MHRPTTSRDGPHIIHTRFPVPTRARPAMAALSPRTDATPSLLPATSSAKNLTEARALRKTEISKMPTISFSPHVQRAQPSSPGKIEACGTTYRQRTREGRGFGRGWGPRACREGVGWGLESTYRRGDLGSPSSPHQLTNCTFFGSHRLVGQVKPDRPREPVACHTSDCMDERSPRTGAGVRTCRAVRLTVRSR